MIELTKEYIEHLREVIELKDETAAVNMLQELYPADIAELFQELDLEEAIYLYMLMDGEKAADVLMELDEEDRRKLLKELPSELIAKRFIDFMETDDAVDLMRELDEDTQEEILSHIEDVEQAGQLLRFDADSRILDLEAHQKLVAVLLENKRAQVDAAAFGKFDRIAGKVDQTLANPGRIEELLGSAASFEPTTTDEQKAAAKAGCEMVKHQTHFVDDEMTDEAKAIFPPNADKSIWHVMQECALSKDDEIALKAYAESLGLIYISTPFSRAAADFLAEIGVAGFKIGSGEANHVPLIRHIASFGKPVILSTGMQTIDSLRPSVQALDDAGVPSSASGRLTSSTSFRPSSSVNSLPTSSFSIVPKTPGKYTVTISGENASGYAHVYVEGAVHYDDEPAENK